MNRVNVLAVVSEEDARDVDDDAEKGEEED